MEFEAVYYDSKENCSAQKSAEENHQKGNTVVFHVHGKGGTAEEAAHYKKIFPEYDIVGMDYKAENPWDSKEEFQAAAGSLMRQYDNIILIANSIGAYFSMHALPQECIRQAFFISPIVNMEKLIIDMMRWANVTEEQLEKRQLIDTEFGEQLSWKYLTYVRNHPLHWSVPTQILYGEKDHLTGVETIKNFAEAHHAGLTIMANGEHWFHTEDQMLFLDSWICQKKKFC